MSEFRELFDEFPSSIVKFKLIDNNEPLIIDANERFINKFTTFEKKSDIEGLYLNKLIVPENKETQSRKFDNNTDIGNKNNKIIKRKTPNGIRIFSYQSIPYKENKGFAIYTDVTEDIQNREHINVLNRVIRHNLRSRLNIIKAHNTNIENKTKSVEIKENCNVISDAISRLVNLSNEAKTINNVLDKTQTNSVINLNTQVSYALHNCKNDIDISYVYVNIPPNTVIKAGDKLHAVVESLVDNAIRHNTSTNPKVNIEFNEINDKYCTLSIIDNGPGIPKSEVDIINQNKEITPLNHSSGLGLWLSKWIIGKYKGDVKIDENYHNGSKVDIWLKM